jgi:GNAT superfamily N-acetyltransferase
MDATPIDQRPPIRIRPLARGEREPVRMVFAGMSPRSRYLRFHSPLPKLPSPTERLLTDVDGRRHIALVAELADRNGWIPLAIGRLIATGDGVAEVAFEVVDEWHGRGLGRLLLTALYHRAGELGYRQVEALVLAENRRAMALVRSVFGEVQARRVGATIELTGYIAEPITTAA